MPVGARGWFMALAGVTLAAFFVFTVVMPAVDRGGFSEFFIIAGIFLAILLVERLVRGR